MKEVTQKWIEAASLDLENISMIIENERLSGHVAFHAQQVIEKTLKALIEEKGERVPKVHSLRNLVEICSPNKFIPINEDLLIAMDTLYIEA